MSAIKEPLGIAEAVDYGSRSTVAIEFRDEFIAPLVTKPPDSWDLSRRRIAAYLHGRPSARLDASEIVRETLIDGRKSWRATFAIVPQPFHEAGLWSDQAVDYPAASEARTWAWLAESDRSARADEIGLMIERHHGVRPFRDS